MQQAEAEKARVAEELRVATEAEAAAHAAAEAEAGRLAQKSGGSTTETNGQGASTSSTSLWEMFKPKPGEWDCEKCMTRNKAEAKVKCMSCEEPKPGAASDAGYNAIQFGSALAPAASSAVSGGFKATFPREVHRLAQDSMRRNFVQLTVGHVGAATDTINQKCFYARDSHDKSGLLIDVLESTGVRNQRVLVFVATKREADMLEEYLYNQHFPATSIHGDRTQTEREQALKSFRNGQAKVLVATDVCARGIDIPNVAMVVNYDMPNQIEDYVHRIERTGRAGNEGSASAFITPKDARLAKDLCKILQDARQEVPPWLERLEDMASSMRYGGGGGGDRWGDEDGERGGE